MERFERALAISPQDYDAAYLLARLYYRIGNRFRDEKRLAEAAIAYEKSAAAFDKSIFGVAYFEQNEWFRAEKEWSRALALKPDFDQARQGLKVVRKKMEIKSP